MKENKRKQTHLGGPDNRLGLGQVISEGSIPTAMDAMPLCSLGRRDKISRKEKLSRFYKNG